MDGSPRKPVAAAVKQSAAGKPTTTPHTGRGVGRWVCGVPCASNAKAHLRLRGITKTATRAITRCRTVSRLVGDVIRARVAVADLYAWAPPDGTEVLIAWLAPLGHVTDERRNGDPLPAWTVRRIGGPFDGLTDHGWYSVHTYGRTDAEAQAADALAHRRLMVLERGPVPVVISSGTVYIDGIARHEGPEDVQYTADRSIVRLVSTYQVDIRIAAA